MNNHVAGVHVATPLAIISLNHQSSFFPLPPHSTYTVQSWGESITLLGLLLNLEADPPSGSDPVMGEAPARGEAQRSFSSLCTFFQRPALTLTLSCAPVFLP